MRTVVFALAISSAFAQRAEFEVASVKPAVTAPMGGRIPIAGPLAEMLGFEGGPGSKTPGRIHYTSVSLKALLARAYDLRPYQISGPSWMETEYYDLDAKYPAETNMEEFRSMLQNLLADRFHLAVHRETKDMARYRLIVAKGGPKLSPPEKLPEYKDEEERRAAMQKQQKANMEALLRRPSRGPFRSFTQKNATTARLAQNLAGYVDRPVTDDTGLEGSYSFSLEWCPDEALAGGENTLPTIFVALQEQLGLKLEPEKGPVQFLVIDRADKVPVAN